MADQIFRRKNILLFDPGEIQLPASREATEIVTQRTAEAQAVAIDIAKLCAKASSLSLSAYKHDHHPFQQEPL
jgi:hypothetical protein